MREFCTLQQNAWSFVWLTINRANFSATAFIGKDSIGHVEPIHCSTQNYSIESGGGGKSFSYGSDKVARLPITGGNEEMGTSQIFKIFKYRPLCKDIC